ncbi:MAG: HPF/RaiA family ribosome-associated protein [Chloroflexi bacterium]|nr:HPF/RaiA family ribosome-associated protein [Chloroflexota bacterium]
MALNTMFHLGDYHLSDTERRHIDGQLRSLERRLAHHPEPAAVLTFTPHPDQRQIEVDLRVQLSPLGQHLISHQAAETAEHAVKLAVDDVERQLERRHAMQRGEPAYGVPSRRLPAHLRPHPPGTPGEGAAEYSEFEAAESEQAAPDVTAAERA